VLPLPGSRPRPGRLPNAPLERWRSRRWSLLQLRSAGPLGCKSFYLVSFGANRPNNFSRSVLAPTRLVSIWAVAARLGLAAADLAMSAAGVVLSAVPALLRAISVEARTTSLAIARPRP
jgi:hypothetical protein